MLRGAVLRRVTADGVATEIVRSADDYVRVLRERFDLDLPEMATRWPAIWERHLAWEASPGARRSRLGPARRPVP